jgi:hypothetical protein
MRINTVYKHFIFRDIYNYTGITVNLESLPDENEVSEEIVD